MLAPAQLLFLPILFPFCFLVYTDVLGLLLVLLAVYCWAAGRPNLASLVAIVSIVVRQDNVVRLAFLCWLTVSGAGGRRWRGALTALVGLGAFAIFVVVNHGVALGDRTAHPFPSFSFGNIYMALWLYFLMFPFQNGATGARIVERLRRDRWLWVLLILLFALCMSTFKVAHHCSLETDHLHNQFFLFARPACRGR